MGLKATPTTGHEQANVRGKSLLFQCKISNCLLLSLIFLGIGRVDTEGFSMLVLLEILSLQLDTKVQAGDGAGSTVPDPPDSREKAGYLHAVIGWGLQYQNNCTDAPPSWARLLFVGRPWSSYMLPAPQAAKACCRSWLEARGPAAGRHTWGTPVQHLTHVPFLRCCRWQHTWHSVCCTTVKAGVHERPGSFCQQPKPWDLLSGQVSLQACMVMSPVMVFHLALLR